MENEQTRNVIRDTRKDIKYVILANRKLSREEMLLEIRHFNYEPLNIKQKAGSEVIITARHCK
jgi:hypothetical protein